MGGLKEAWAFLRGVMQGSFNYKEQSVRVLRKEAYDENDTFLLLCFADLIGVPLPTSYYTLELLPHVSSELVGWEKRILERRSVLAEQFGKHDWHGG